MVPQTARITFLASPDFKEWLKKEAKKTGISISELIRLRCQNSPSAEELLIVQMAVEVKKAVQRASTSLDKGLRDAEVLLKEIQRGKVKK